MKNPVVKSFRELEVYKLHREAAQFIFQRSRVFPRDEKYSLTDQIRRASRAVGAMVAEAWGRRRFKAVFVNKVDEALGEANEVRAWLDSALDCDYITAKEHADLDARYVSIGAMLSRMIDTADSFCHFAPSKDYRAQ